MSEWIRVEKDAISTSKDGTELHIWIESDDFGNRYLSIEGEELEYLKELLPKL